MEFNFSTKSYGASQILRESNFILPEGRVTALLGPSGVGKTTLLQLIAGLEPDDNGQVLSLPKIGMVFQEPRLLPWATVHENIATVGEVGNVLAELGLSDVGSLYPRQLSLGMARRVAIARALAAQPKLLILDEPFASLDADTSNQVKQVLTQIFNVRKTTVLLVTHQAEDVSELADYRLTLTGRPAKLLPN